MTAPVRFDGQAGTYEARAGLAPQVWEQAAHQVRLLAGMGRGDLLVELGAGTGGRGQAFADEIGTAGLRYLGLDLSLAMLARFRRRLDPGMRGRWLIQADGNRPWPLAPGTVRAFFSSRAVHLMEVHRVLAEVLRLAHPGGAVLVLGRLKRHPQSVKARMRQEMRRRLKREGFAPRQGEARGRRLLEGCVEAGGRPMEARVVARFPVRSTPRASLESWRGKAGLGGLDPPAAIKEEVLAGLGLWAAETWGGLDRVVESEECYVLEGVRITPSEGGPDRHE